MSARYAGRGIVSVSWTTGSEGGVQGFYVTRAASASGAFERVSDMIAPRGDGQTYNAQDRVHAALGRALYYAVEIVGADGTITSSGPTAITLPAPRRSSTDKRISGEVVRSASLLREGSFERRASRSRSPGGPSRWRAPGSGARVPGVTLADPSESPSWRWRAADHDAVDCIMIGLWGRMTDCGAFGKIGPLIR